MLGSKDASSNLDTHGPQPSLGSSEIMIRHAGAEPVASSLESTPLRGWNDGEMVADPHPLVGKMQCIFYPSQAPLLGEESGRAEI